MSDRKHGGSHPAGGPRSLSGMTILKRKPIWSIAVAGGLAILGALTGWAISKPGGKTGSLGDLVQAEQARDQELSASQRHRDVDLKIDDLRALHSDPGFEKLPVQQREYVRGRLAELTAYREYNKKLAAIDDLKDVRGLEQLEHIRTALSELKVPAEYLVEWSTTDAYLKHAELVADGQALKSTVDEMQKAYTSLVNDGTHVIEKSAEANLPGRAREVLERGKQVPDPVRDRDKLIPGSKRITYATVFQFTALTRFGDEWKKVEARLKPLLDSSQP